MSALTGKLSPTEVGRDNTSDKATSVQEPKCEHLEALKKNSKIQGSYPTLSWTWEGFKNVIEEAVIIQPYIWVYQEK